MTKWCISYHPGTITQHEVEAMEILTGDSPFLHNK